MTTSCHVRMGMQRVRRCILPGSGEFMTIDTGARVCRLRSAITPIRQKSGWIALLAVPAVMAAPSQVYADNFGSTRDLESIFIAVVAILAVVILLLLFWEMFATAAAI